MQEKQPTINAAMSVERAIDELRRQSPVAIYETDGACISNYPAEFLTEAMFKQRELPGMQLLISAPRAKMLGLPETDTRIDASYLTYETLMAIVDPLAPQTEISAPYTPASAIDRNALKLAKYASLMPALLLTPDDGSTVLRLDAAELAAYIANPQTKVIKTAHASLPIEGAAKATLVSFRAEHATSVHLALIIGDIGPSPLTRIHSSCVTGDILGSLRCDCGDQLKLALAELVKNGSGILVYLHQEGRGIGITNKLRSYQLQERGIDTFTANLMLGFDEDERDFSIAASILKMLEVDSIRMLTNNPHKLAALEKAGIRIAERVPLVSESHAHNHAYIEAKVKKAGHLF